MSLDTLHYTAASEDDGTGPQKFVDSFSYDSDSDLPVPTRTMHGAGYNQPLRLDVFGKSANVEGVVCLGSKGDRVIAQSGNDVQVIELLRPGGSIRRPKIAITRLQLTGSGVVRLAGVPQQVEKVNPFASPQLTLAAGGMIKVVSARARDRAQPVAGARGSVEAMSDRQWDEYMLADSVDKALAA